MYYDADGSLTLADATDSNKFGSDGVILDEPIKENAVSTIYIYLDVEWISDLTVGGSLTNGDGFDTWCGMWVSGFAFGLTVEAYQAS